MTDLLGTDWSPWPADFAQYYKDAGYWLGKDLRTLSREWAREYGESLALVTRDGRISYRELDARIERRAAGLSALGLSRGDRVVLQLPNRQDFVVTLFAVFQLGVVPVVALPAHRRSEIGYFCAFTEAVAYICPAEDAELDHVAMAREIAGECPSLHHVLVSGRLPGSRPTGGPAVVELDDVDRLGDAPADPGPEAGDLAVLLLSGGTTGVPKLVPRTHDDWSYSGRAVAEACGYDRSTVHLVCLPIGHNWTLTHGMLATFHAGGVLVLAPSPDPRTAFELVERERITDTGLVPGVALLWMEAAELTDSDLSSLRQVAIGGTKLNAELARRVEPALGCRLQQAFGMAEGLCGFHRADDTLEVRLESQGIPVSPADEVRVVDHEDRDVPTGETGELLARGPYTVRGYYRAPEHNAKTFTADGFYRTGDVVRLLPGGYLVFEGRVKDQINRGGDKIAAEELENHLLAHPAVRDVAVVGLPDEILGERICACVVPRGTPPALAELVAHLAERGVAGYKQPDLLQIVEAFPRTGMGKVSKKALVAQFSGRR